MGRFVGVVFVEQGLGQEQRFGQVQVWVVGQPEVEVGQQQNFVED